MTFLLAEARRTRPAANNRNVEAALSRAYVEQANAGEELARGCRAIAIKHWLRLLRTIKSAASPANAVVQYKAIIRDAYSEQASMLGPALVQLGVRSFYAADKAMWSQLTPNQTSLLQEAVEVDLGPLADVGWAPGRPIHPLPPDPTPLNKRRYVGPDPKLTEARAKKIVKEGDWQERLAGWSKLIGDKKEAADIIARGVAAGEPIASIAKKLEPIVGNVSSSAMRIARTEAARIHNRHAELAMERYDSMIAGYRVINPLDDRTRPKHRERAREQTSGFPPGRIYWKDGHQRDGGYSATDKPELPDGHNCRCSYVPVMIEPDAEIIKEKQRKLNRVDDIDHDVSEEELEKFRADERERLGMTEKKAAAGIRNASDDINAQIIGTVAWQKRQQIPPSTPIRPQYTQAEVDAVDRYLGGDYRVINGGLRIGQPDHPAIRDTVRDLDSAIAKSRLDADAVLYRGIIVEAGTEYRVGDTFSDKAYTSTSSDKAVGDAFTKKAREIGKENWQPVRVEFEMPKGSQALNAVDMFDVAGRKSGYTHEREFLLPRDAAFTIKSVAIEGTGKNAVHVIRVVPKSVQPPPAAKPAAPPLVAGPSAEDTARLKQANDSLAIYEKLLNDGYAFLQETATAAGATRGAKTYESLTKRYNNKLADVNRWLRATAWVFDNVVVKLPPSMRPTSRYYPTPPPFPPIPPMRVDVRTPTPRIATPEPTPTPAGDAAAKLAALEQAQRLVDAPQAVVTDRATMVAALRNIKATGAEHEELRDSIAVTLARFPKMARLVAASEIPTSLRQSSKPHLTHIGDGVGGVHSSPQNMTRDNAYSKIEIAARPQGERRPSTGPRAWTTMTRDYVLRHEFGHYVDMVASRFPKDPNSDAAKAAREMRNDFWTLWKQADAVFNMHEHGRQSREFQVTMYARSNAKEYFAEIFAVYTSPKYERGQLPKAVEAFCDKHLGGS